MAPASSGSSPAGPSPAGSSPAVDLGCGPGAQALALAALGFSPVIAVDTSQTLLDELTAAAKRLPGATVRPVRADIRTALPELNAPGETAVIVCMGDTLTHLPAKDDVPALLADSARALAPGGRLVITYRDLTRPLEGTDRFLPVRGDADRILTCFLEYLDADTVRVHDLLHLRTTEGWELQTSSYPKLRIAADRLADRCRDAGLEVAHEGAGPGGMRVLVAVRPE